MGRRRRNDEVAFGTDSFLDIVANIVGILIILLVIAGVRVSQMPVVLPVVSAADPPKPADALPVLSIEAPSPALLPVVVETTPLPTPPPPPEPIKPPKPIQPPPELVARIDATAQDLDRLAETKQGLAANLAMQADDVERLRQQVATSVAMLTNEQQQMDQGRRSIVALQTELETGQREVAGLFLELAEVDASRPPPQILRHKLTPIGKVVEGDELHCLLSGGRVAVVPVDDLAQKLKEHMLRKKAQILRGQTRVGSVGPVKGFTMEYVIERETVSLMEELRTGSAIVRIGVSEWRILPQPRAVFESADVALLPRSRFLNALRAAGSDATLTFWVYPDSFALHRELQDFAHDNGFNVAARPLPHGIPIAGSSTRGSRSIAQ